MRENTYDTANLNQTLDRRRFLKLALGTGSMALLGAWGATSTRAAQTVEPYLGTSIRSFDNPFHVEWAKGSKKFAAEVGLSHRHDIMLSEGDSQRQISQVQAFIAKAGKGAILAIDPHLPPDTAPLVKICEDAGVYCMTFFVKDKDLHPTDFKYWVAHAGLDGRPQGQAVADALFKAMGGSGKIVSILGPRGHSVSNARGRGLDEALKATGGKITKLAEEHADWDRTKGLNVMQSFLVAHPDLTGVWCANDQMALGALEALRSAGKAGKVPIVGIDGAQEALEGIKKGEYTASLSFDPPREGYYGLALPYAAFMGKLDPTKQPPVHREFDLTSTTITKDNVDDWLKNHVYNVPSFNKDDYWSIVHGPLCAECS